MDVLTKITLPKYIFDFYAGASAQIRGSTPEDVMADTLIRYAGMVSPNLAKKTRSITEQNGTKPSDKG